MKTGDYEGSNIRNDAELVLRQTSEHFFSNPLPYWFTDKTALHIQRINQSIIEAISGQTVHALQLALAGVVDRLACRDPLVPVPVRRRNCLPTEHQEEELRLLFLSAVDTVASKLEKLKTSSKAAILTLDATETRSYSEHPRPHLILTSPPYGAAQKYPRSTRLPLLLLGLQGLEQYRELNTRTIGREDVSGLMAELDGYPRSLADDLERISAANPQRAMIYSEYFSRMGLALRLQTENLAPGGHYVLVASSNSVAGSILPTHQHLASLLASEGLVETAFMADAIPSRSLMTKRAKSAGQPIAHEYIHIFRKP